MNYKIRDGIVLTRICDEYLLVSCSSARPYCPPSVQINETAAFVWHMLEQGMNNEEMIHEIRKEYEIEGNGDVGNMLNQYLTELAENGYLTEKSIE